MAIPDQVLDGIDNLDPLPFTVQKLISALSDDDTSLQEIGKVIEYDPAVAANILRVANSAFYSGRRRIDDTRDAVVRLGTATLLDIILGSYLKELTVSAPMYNLSEDELWLHAAVSSIAVKEMAKEADQAEIPKTAVIAALVHDVGKIIMVRYISAEMDEILELCGREELTFVDAERRLFGCDHAEVGGAIARKWRFPDSIIEAIEQHHQVPLENPSMVLDAVVLANLVSKTIGVGLGAEGLNVKADEGSYQRLGLDFKAFCRICAQTAAQISQLKQAYGIAEHV